MISPVTSRAGVTSNAKFAAGLSAGVSRTSLRRWTLSARRRLRLVGRVAVVMAPPKLSRRLNRQYRRRDRPTNVLSFDYAHEAQVKQQFPLAGEIILCPTVIRREAREQGREYRAYLRFLLEHGLIHLLGRDHRTPQEQRVWTQIEQRLL